jgi:formate dehydrogenase major subunit
MFDNAISGEFRGLFVHGEDIAQSDPNTMHVEKSLKAMDLVIVQDLFLNETSKFAHVFLPGTSFLEKDGTFTNAERRINRVRPVMAAKNGKQEWQIVCELSQAMGYDMHYENAAQIMDEIAEITPTFKGVSFAMLDEVGSVQWPCNDAAPTGTPIMHVDGFVRGQGQFMETPFVPTEERSNRKFPLLLTTGRILSQYNVGAQTRRTANVTWHPEDVLEIHESDAAMRGIVNGQKIAVSSRIGETILTAEVSERVPAGVPLLALVLLRGRLQARVLHLHLRLGAQRLHPALRPRGRAQRQGDQGAARRQTCQQAAPCRLGAGAHGAAIAGECHV